MGEIKMDSLAHREASPRLAKVQVSSGVVSTEYVIDSSLAADRCGDIRGSTILCDQMSEKSEEEARDGSLVFVLVFVLFFKFNCCVIS